MSYCNRLYQLIPMMLQRSLCYKRPYRQISCLFHGGKRSVINRQYHPPIRLQNLCRRFTTHHHTHQLSYFNLYVSEGTNIHITRQQHRWTSNDVTTTTNTNVWNNPRSDKEIISQIRAAITKKQQKSLSSLSRQLVFLFSDFNLRNNEYGRSVINQYNNEYLPLKDILELRPIQKFMRGYENDPKGRILDAIATYDHPLVQLTVEEIDGTGVTIVKRSPPFSYIDNVNEHHKKMMIVEARPAKLNKFQSDIRSLLVGSDGNSKQSVSYWKYNDKRGVINIEFTTEEDAMKAWDNLEKEDGKIEVENVRSTERKVYRLQLDNASVIVRPVVIEDSDETIDDDEVDTSSVSQTEVETSSATETPVDTESVQMPSKPWEINRTPSLGQFIISINQLYHEHTQYPPPSREWLRELIRDKRTKKDIEQSIEHQYTLRLDLYRDTVNLVSTVKNSIERGKIRGLGGKDAYTLSDSLGEAMLIYSHMPALKKRRAADEDGEEEEDDDELLPSPYEACHELIDILHILNIDVHPMQYFYAIRAACQDSRWEDAADIFLSQIVGDEEFLPTGGFVPIDPTLGWDKPLEMGMYAVARDALTKSKVAQENGTELDANMLPSKRVFDIAMKICMISPQSQENYIMAAGKALARAGLWKDCLLLTTDKESIAKYGPSIATASMLACIEAKRYTDAIAAYDLFMSGNQSTASEYQWGGGTVTVVKPLCRDLLLSSMGHVKKGGFSQDAMAVFKEIIEDGSSMSKAALLGLAHSLENDGDWQSSIKLLRGYIDLVYRKRNPSWRIVPDALDVNRDDDDNTLSPHDQNNLLTDILASVMRVCNREGQYGLALILCSIVDRSYASGLNLNGDLKIHDCSSTVRSILSQRVVSENQQVLEVYLKSLYWLGCGSTVNELVNAAQSRYNNIEASTPWGLRHNDLPHGESWINATIASGRVLEAMSAINRERQSLSEESRMLFERGLARAMGHCIDSDQPSAALYLFEHASVILSASEEEDPTLAGRVRTFFGFEDSYGDNTGGGLFQTHTTVDLKDLHLSDSFIGAVIKSYCKLGQYDKACAALDDGLISSGQQSLLMSQSNNNTLEALLHVDIDKCMSFLDSMDVRLVNPTTFSMIARHFAKNEMWPEIGEVYNRAKRAGCISEDLGLIAMQAVAEAELLDGKIVVLRGVVKDIVAVVGIKSDEFIKSRYWSIKRSVGFHYARLLMRWNTPATSAKEELLFAANEMRQCTNEGLVAKNAPLMCIVINIPKLYGADHSLTTSQRQSSVNLILEACHHAKQSGFIKSYHFTSGAASSLRAFGANKECIQLVRTLLPSSSDESNVKQKCNHRIAMEEGIYAAFDEKDEESLQLITDVYEKSGFDSSRLFEML